MVSITPPPSYYRDILSAMVLFLERSELKQNKPEGAVADFCLSRDKRQLRPPVHNINIFSTHYPAS